MEYRREIDGLRALAVLSVILFHAGFQTFGGGFVGVDIFFVISGYLITTIILAELEVDKFSIINFYERRARRILPALFLVMLACLPFAWIWLLPSDMRDFSKSLVAVSVFASNILFWRESGYFSTAAELKPLLHTWSLAIEEQYYLLFPILLILTWRFGKRWILGLFLVIFFLNLAAAQWGSVAKPVAAFYLLPTRGWELLAGAFVAFYLSEGRNKSQVKVLSEVGGVLGAALVIYAILFFDKQIPFPSLYTLVPTIGTALIILCATQNTLVGKLLGNKIFVGIGLISYSAYLWHQPLFAFAKQRTYEQPSALLLGFFALISLALAYISWKYVELPFRNKSITSRKQIFLFSLFGSFFFITLGLLGYFNSGFESRFTLPTQIIESLRSFNGTDKAKLCFDKESVHTRDDWYCDVGIPDNKISFVVFGDSHSLSLHDNFNTAATEEKKYGIFTGASGCIPFLGIHALRGDQSERDCNQLNRRVFEFAKEHKVEKVFLVARWTYYTDGGYEGEDFSYIGLSKSDVPSKSLSRKAFNYGLENTVKAYKESGIKLYIIGQVPQQLFQPDRIYYRLYLYGERKENVTSRLEYLSVSKIKHRELQSYVASLFSPLASEGLIRLVSFDDVLCPSEKCFIGTSEKSFYYDDNHLSSEGERLLLDEIRNYIFE